MQPLRETRPTLRPLAGFAALAMLAWLAFVAALDQRMAPLSSSGLTADAEAGAPTRSAGAWGKLPLSFEANVGQAEGGVDFLARGSGYTLFLKSAEAVLALRQAAPARPERPSGAVLRMQLSGADPYAAVTGALRLLGKANYFIGNDPTRWRTDVSTYGRVLYKDIYPGIDLAYYGDQGQLEYDFLVAPGTDPSVIGLRYAGVDTMEVDSHGDLILKVAGAEIRQRKPLIYQENGDIRREVAGGYSIRGRDEIKFAVGTYDLSRPLVIDPVLVYSTYLGGSVQDEGHGIAVDSAGSAYVTGFTTSPDFPAAFAFQSAYVSARDAFVTKLNPSGNALVYSTYLGGIGDEIGFGIAVDSAGSAYVTGYTGSMNFPTAFAFQNTYAGDLDAFVTKLNPSGSALLYSTFLGGSGQDEGHGIAVDSAGSAYVAGLTNSTNFPTALAFQNTNAGSLGVYDAFVTKLSPSGAGLVYSTYLGGSGNDLGLGIAADSAGSAYVTGSAESTNFPTAFAFQSTRACCGSDDAFVTKLNPSGTALLYSTYLGGTGSDEGNAIAVDSVGSAYVAGSTTSTNFPTAFAFQNTYGGGAVDAFVTKLNATGSALLYSTYLGGNSTDDGRAIAVDSAGSAYVTGSTDSTNFPSASANAGVNDAYVTKLSPGGTGLVYSIRLGGGGSDAGIGIALDSPGSAYVTGSTGSTDFPTASAFQNAYAGGGDAFVTKLAVVVTVGPPATLTLLPAAATNTVGQQHCVTATVKDAFGNPVVGVVVDFSVGPSAPTTFPTPSIGAGTTNGNGQATFCYTAALPGDDAIHAFADSNNNGMQDLAEPFGDATKTWTPPQSTQLCEVTITDGGWIIADNGDRANFAANAKVLPDGTLQGQQQYRDQGPAEPIDVHSTEITATTCSSDRTTASIFGKATIDGSGSHVFRIDVTDVGSGGTDDTYGIMLDTGYMSGQHVLSGGNVTIH